MNKLLKEAALLSAIVITAGALVGCGAPRPATDGDPEHKALISGFSSIPTTMIPVEITEQAAPSLLQPPNTTENTLTIYLTGSTLPYCSYDLALDASTNISTTTYTTNGVTRAPDEFFVRTSEGQLLSLSAAIEALDENSMQHHMILLNKCPFPKDPNNRVANGTKFDLISTGFISTSHGLQLVDPHRFIATVNQK
jgi:hypothetical protein